ncbi:squalene/phytoene synthase family protein [Streptomyces sp. A7024]|uniref:Squalene/phytoene synthase family protein n=1 Tax=Streptomyces coryli TaxID=1128680 RepID=A0A6G4U635_9ACTN|nr:squalene/phytoene synthase family protein [Streptomyces coryli]
MSAELVEILKQNSRTFFLPIMRLDEPLRGLVAAYYLANRALDEIEDHPGLAPANKAELLRGLSRLLQQARFTQADTDRLFRPYEAELAPVTRRFHEWAVEFPPPDIAPRLWDSLAALADRMADWVEAEFRVRDEADLDRYTFAVASAIGITLSDLWSRHAGIVTPQPAAVAFGRAVQTANITWNRRDDLARGVDFFPAGWTELDMCGYVRRQLPGAQAYVAGIPAGPIRDFCAITLDICTATLAAIEQGTVLDRAVIQAIAARHTVP